MENTFWVNLNLHFWDQFVFISFFICKDVVWFILLGSSFLMDECYFGDSLFFVVVQSKSRGLLCWSLLFSLISFYTAAPLSLCSSCIPEVYHFAASGLAQFIVQGKRPMPDVEISPLDAVIPLSYLGWRQWIGAALFFWGWIHQQRCHQILVQ